MDLEHLSDEKKFQIGVIGVFLVGVFLLAVGLGLYFFKVSGSSDDIQIISASENPQGSGMEIVVHVDGAVNTPGIYRLPQNARIDDAIRVAGGLTEEADQTRINLAAKIADGQKIYIQRVGELVSQSSSGSVAGESVTGPININTASESQLDKLPGIGPVTAGKIIASRPYSAPEDLLSKKVVSSSVYEKIRDLITVY